MHTPTRSRLLTLTLSTLTLAALARPREAGAVCTPLMSLPSVGDFELMLDPAHPPHLLYVTNQGSPPGNPAPNNIRVAQLDGADGLLRQGPTLVASNYMGASGINGPEFATLPPIPAGFPFAGQQTVGILFTGPSGVHAAFRAPGAAWDSFVRDLGGGFFPANLPPPLPGTTVLSNPGGGFPTGLGYNAFGGQCGSPLVAGSACYGNLVDTVLTPVTAFATAEGLLAADISPHPTRPGGVVLSACTGAGACGLYSGTIDNLGGLLPVGGGAPNTAHFRFLASTGAFSSRRETLRGGVIPATGTVMWAVALVGAAGVNDDDIAFYSENAAGALTPAGVKLSLDKVEHFRMVEGGDGLYLDYQVRDMGPASPLNGSFHIKQSQVAVGGAITVAAPLQYFTGLPYGIELVYLPGAPFVGGRLAYYQAQSWLGQNVIARCWL